MICGLLGFAAGYLDFGTRQPDPGDARVPAPASRTIAPPPAVASPPAAFVSHPLADTDDSTTAGHALEDQLTALQVQHRLLQSRLNDQTSAVQSAYTVIPRRMLMDLHIPSINEEGRLDPAMLELLDIQPSEQAGLESAFQDTLKRVEQLEFAHATIVSESDDGFVLSIPPYETEGKTLEDELIAQINAILGEKRARVLSDIGELENRFGQFGRARQTFTINVDPSGNLRVENIWALEAPSRKSDGRSQLTGGTERNTYRPDKIPEDLMSLIPETFRHLLKADQPDSPPRH